MRLSDAIDVWVADLDSVPENLLWVLCDAERERAGRLLDARARSRWSASRAVLRDLLGRATGVDPAALEFELGPHGKPSLRRSPGGAPRFNLSHSGPLALYGISFDRELGIDVEALEDGRARNRNEVAIARRMLGAEVARRLEALDEVARRREFLVAWVAHEARMKCLGHGLDRVHAAQGLDGLALGGSGEAGGPQALWVTPLAVGGRSLAALAVRGGKATVRMQRWQER